MVLLIDLFNSALSTSFVPICHDINEDIANYFLEQKIVNNNDLIKGEIIVDKTNIALIRSIIANMYDQTVAKDIHVLYGGGVDVNNAAEILKIRSVDGFLLGRVSLNPKDFYKIIQFAPEYIESKNIIKNKNK